MGAQPVELVDSDEVQYDQEGQALSARTTATNQGAYANACINSLFEDDQYELLPAASVSSGLYYIDMHKTLLSGVSAGIEMNTADQPTELNYGRSWKMTATGSNAIASFGCTQQVKYFDIYAGLEGTFSIYVKTDISGMRLGIDDQALSLGDDIHPGDGEWKRLKFTKTISSSATQLIFSVLNLDDGFTPGPVSDTNFLEIKGFKFQLGDTATPVTARENNLDLCKDYYEVLGGDGGTSYHANGQISASGNSGNFVIFYKEKVNTPSITVSSGVIQRTPSGFSTAPVFIGSANQHKRSAIIEMFYGAPPAVDEPAQLRFPTGTEKIIIDGTY